ncbi:MAG: shikimate dehydrogenase [Thermodesulfobacteriota bacterium]|nr:shikimate dehydrogenase [Thermodesulfobacteriota bacterium]
MNISGTTRVLSILAHPSSKVTAPCIYNHIFHAMGLDMVYIAHDVRPGAIENTLKQFRSWINLQGFNVTIPHKESACHFVDEMDQIATRIKVINTVSRDPDGRLKGYNTDGMAAVNAMGDVRGSNCLVIGAGGAARAIIYALLEKNASHVMILNRSETRARQVMGLFDPGMVSLFHDEMLPAMDFIVQTTPVADSIPFGLDLSLLKDNVKILEIVMRKTALFARAKAMGLCIIPGHAMLYHQTKKNFKIFTGLDLDTDLLDKAFAEVGYSVT